MAVSHLAGQPFLVDFAKRGGNTDATDETRIFLIRSNPCPIRAIRVPLR